jgi:hypothetical protein
MTEAIKNIVVGYMKLKNRQALQDIRDHRQRLLRNSRTLSTSWVSTDNMRATLQEEISIVDAALGEFDSKTA